MATTDDPLVSEAIRCVEHSLLLSPILPDRDECIPLLDRLRAYGVPGLSVAVIRRGRLEWARGFGVRRAGKFDPVTDETLFQAGSISKAVTAVAVLRVCQEGQLDLDEDVNAYLTSWSIPPSDGWQPRVTLRQLLSHSAGTTVSGFFGYRHGDPLPTVPQLLDGLQPANSRPVRVNAIPGTQFSYSGGGTTIVQQILMDVTGEPFPTLMQRLVLAPLGMRHSTFDQPLPPSRLAEAATGHWMGGDAVDGGRSMINPQLAAGGLSTTPSDLARLLIDLWRAWTGEPDALLDTSAAREMLQPQGAPHIGLGFFLSGEGAAARFGHTGDTLGFNADMLLFRELGSGAVALANSITGMTPIGDVFRTLADLYDWPDLAPPRRRELSVAPGTLAGYGGDYRLPTGFTLRLTTDDNNLFLEPEGQPLMQLYPFAEDRFFSRAVGAELDFIRGQSGRIAGLRLHQPESTLLAIRAE
jgi:CubicO group peptidase (beta-lactamase class C family)